MWTVLRVAGDGSPATRSLSLRWDAEGCSAPWRHQEQEQSDARLIAQPRPKHVGKWVKRAAVKRTENSTRDSRKALLFY